MLGIDGSAEASFHWVLFGNIRDYLKNRSTSIEGCLLVRHDSADSELLEKIYDNVHVLPCIKRHVHIKNQQVDQLKILTVSSGNW